jgi:hypothetical protein
MLNDLTNDQISLLCDIEEHDLFTLARSLLKKEPIWSGLFPTATWDRQTAISKSLPKA